MLYLFTSNDAKLLHLEVGKWKHAFIAKHGDFNVLDIKVEEVDNNFLSEQLLAGTFFGGKKLVILSGDFSKNGADAFIMKQAKNIQPETFVILSQISPDKRSKFYKFLKEHAELKDFQISGEADAKNYIQKKYGDKIDMSALNLLYRYKSGNIGKMISEIEKLLILNEKITMRDVEQGVFPELEESIFECINALLYKNQGKFFATLNIMLESDSIYRIYNSLLSNLRTQVYIGVLKEKKVSSSAIGTHLKLGKRAFLIDKKYAISGEELKNTYFSLIEIDKKMKTGKMIGTTEDDFRFELEKVFLENM